MKKFPFVNFNLSGVSLNDYGLKIPSPFSSLEISNGQITSMTSWTLTCIVGGDSDNKINVAAFEALLYSAAQASSGYANSQGISVSFVFGWQNEDGSIGTYSSYQGFTIKFSVSISGQYMIYRVTGFATLAAQMAMPVLHIPALCGIVQSTAVVEALAVGTKATNYYDLDIDHDDAPTMIEHNAMTTSFNKYIRGTYTAEDDFDSFPGILKLAKSYSSSRDAAGVDQRFAKNLAQVFDAAVITPISKFLKKSLTDNTPQSSSYQYWVDPPTMIKKGIIHFKNSANVSMNNVSDTLEYGTANTNILSINGSYNGVAYNMTDMNFASVGFAIDASGNSIAQNAEVVNSWSSSLSDVFQTVNIINDVNAIASQFSGDFTVQLPGQVKKYEIAQPISLLIMVGNTVSPASGVYNVTSVSHEINSQFITTLKLQRLVMSSANQVASAQNIFVSGSSNYSKSSYTKTDNIISTGKVDFGQMYPDFTNLYDPNYAIC